MHVADVTWTGQSTRYVRTGIENAGLDLDRLRHVWDAVSPVNYFHKFRAEEKRTLVIYATYDLTFLPEYSKMVVDAFREYQLDHEVRVLPCGHSFHNASIFSFNSAYRGSVVRQYEKSVSSWASVRFSLGTERAF